VLAAAYLVLFLIKLQTSSQQPINPRHVSSVLSLAATMLRVGFVPVAVGGPWRWFVPGGDYGFAAETPALTQVSWVLAALIVGASLRYRRHALRSWLILAGWLLLADFGPVAISRLTEYPASCWVLTRTTWPIPHLSSPSVSGLRSGLSSARGIPTASDGRGQCRWRSARLP
jgi:hypothetical protein